MTPEQFCYWLQGRAELQPDSPPSVDEWHAIAAHLATVFTKVTPYQQALVFPSPLNPGNIASQWPNAPARAECLAAGKTI